MRAFFCIIVLLFLFPASASCEGKPTAPPELNEIMDHLSEIEESFENREWEEARKHTEDVNLMVGKILGELRKHTHRDDLNSFRIKFMDLRESIMSRHLEFTEESFIDLQKAFFVLTDYYNFKTPMFLEIVGKYINEAAEGLEQNDFEDIAQEMSEINAFIESFDDDLLKHGITSEAIEEFIVLTYRTKRAAKNHDKEKIKMKLGLLKTMHLDFIKSYK